MKLGISDSASTYDTPAESPRAKEIDRMNSLSQQALALVKIALVAIVIIGGFVLVAIGRMPAQDMYKATAALVAALVVALGISGGGSAVGAAMAKLRGALPLLLVIGAVTLGCSACSSAQVGQAIPPTLDTVACILTTVSKDVAAGKSWTDTVADTALTCGADAATIATVWAEHVHAEVVEGFVPRMPVPGTDGGR